jgi:hypothetical protein
MTYTRYTIQTELTTNLAYYPSRFIVDTNRIKLAKLLLGEIIHTRGYWKLVSSRPCVYGVFSGPLGGFLPRPEHCVGCLRCTVQYPDIVQIRRNPERLKVGDSYFTPDIVDTVIYEASTGRVPVHGAGYRGPFGGNGWDAMWTDMSEIVRPTRDGIHGREFISTSIDLGSKPLMLAFDEKGIPLKNGARWVSLPIPYLLESPLSDPRLAQTLRAAAETLETGLILPIEEALEADLAGESLIPILHPSQASRLDELRPLPQIVEFTSWDPDLVDQLRHRYDKIVIGVRTQFDLNAVDLVHAGVDFLHLHADFQGQTQSGFVLEAIRQVHGQLVDAGLRQRISLIGSGGIIAAEHVPKAIIAGLDAVALDTALLIALQAHFENEYRTKDTVGVSLPEFPQTWGQQRVMNLIASWRDQLLEILGAMGMREVRRLRGEIGRAMFQVDLEAETFAEIDGFERREHA